MLAGGATAYAQSTEPTEVMLKDNKTKVSWSTFVNAINNPSSVQGTADRSKLTEAEEALTAAQDAQTKANAALPIAQKAYDDAEAQLKKWQDDRSDLQSEQSNVSANLTKAYGNTEMVQATWLSTAYANASEFYPAYDNDIQSSPARIYYKTETTGRGKVKMIVSFNPEAYNDGYTAADEATFYELLEGDAAKTVANLSIYFGKKADGTYNYPATTDGIRVVTSYVSGNNSSLVLVALGDIENLLNTNKYAEFANQKDRETLEAQLDALTDSITKLTENIKAYTEAKTASETVTDTRSEQTKLREALTAAQAAKTAADEQVTTWERKVATETTNYNNAVAAASATALENYKTVTLTADVTANESIDSFDGTIFGGKHVIALGDGVTALFGTLSGVLTDAAVNGTICRANRNATFNNVASWANNANTFIGTFYDGHNNVTERIGTLGQLGYTARESFGVNFADNKLVALTAASKVYSITEYQPNSTKHYYVQTLADSKFYTENNAEYSIPVNTFVKSDSYDLEGDNIFYEDNSCPNVVIEDEDNVAFYCPVDLQAGKVTYPREFHAGMNSVCLPFEITYDSNENIEALCTFDKETDVKFWFKKDGQKADANTPILISAKADFTLDNLNDIVIKQTPTTQMIIDEGDADDPSKAYGIFKKATRDQFQGGASEAHKVYGLTKSGTFQAAGDGVNFPAFRLVLYSANAQQSGPMAAPRRIGILDEKGIEITDGLTTGIDSVTTGEEASDLEITTGAGEITFTAAADYGRVEVYTLDGKVAAIAKVAAGTTTVNVQNGVYIVMGKKVMVK